MVCKWYVNNKNSSKASHMEQIASQFRFCEEIKEPTHLLENWRSCINLIFTSQTSMGNDSGVYVSLQSNCHQQLVFVFLSPIYERTMWIKMQTNTDHIKRAINYNC